MNIFLTGASSGIGQALAKEFAANGATLGLVARREDKLKELIAELPNPELHTAIVCDVTDRDRLIEEARKFDEACGGVDIAVACAGISVGVKTQYREDLDVFDKVFDTNVFAMASTFHAFIDPMIKRKRRNSGRNCQCRRYSRSSGKRSLLQPSKSAAITYCESLRVEMQKYGVKVVTISPGFVKTPLTAHNPYKMPFIMEPEAFAKEAVKVIMVGKKYATIPWEMGVLSKILRLIPNWLFDKILASRKQKPRSGTAGTSKAENRPVSEKSPNAVPTVNKTDENK